jgi:bla regulator protein blaR1
MVRSDDSSCVTLEARGNIGFTDGDDDVGTVSPRGFIHVMQRLHGVTQEFRVDADASGALTRVYRRDGEEHPVAEAHDWLAVLVPVIERESGIGAEARVARLRQKGGVRAVLDDARLIESDGVKRRYLEILIQSGSLTRDDLAGITRVAATISSDGDRRGTLERVLDAGGGALIPDVMTAAHDISSDGDKASVLLRAIDVVAAGDSLSDTFFGVAAGISSDGDKARVLSAVVRKRGTSAREVGAAISVARSISSGGDKARVLLDVVNARGATERNQLQAVSVANTINSDGDKARVLLAVVRTADVSKAVLRAAIAVAHHINSDGDKANVLRTAARLPGAADKDVRADILRAAKSIASDGDYRSVMQALDNVKQMD